MTQARKKRLELGDFQTPSALAEAVCARLVAEGVAPDLVLEPTCGIGRFLAAACQAFPLAERYVGYELQTAHLNEARGLLSGLATTPRTELRQADFFATDWDVQVGGNAGPVLILGNPPWVTSAMQGRLGGQNLPEKHNHHRRLGLEAITGSANFDISEWMLSRLLGVFARRPGWLAMLVKTGVARKILLEARARGLPVIDAALFAIDARKAFDCAVSACLVYLHFDPGRGLEDWNARVFETLGATVATRLGQREGLLVRDLEAFDAHRGLLGQTSPPWRSGVKHDAAAVMELLQREGVLRNGLGESVTIEPDCLFPLLKGSEVASGRAWSGRYLLLPQRRPGEDTTRLQEEAPRTWAYLQAHASRLARRRSRIYLSGPPFSVFGVGPYAFLPWKVAVSGLHPRPMFRLVGPVQGRAVQFDDTVYYLSFATQEEALLALAHLQHPDFQRLLESLVFRDEKRPVKAALLNRLDWRKVEVRT